MEAAAKVAAVMVAASARQNFWLPTTARELMGCCLQSKHFKVYTSFFVLEDAVLLFRTSPPTAKTGYRRYLIFGMDTHQVPTGGPTEAIFDI